MLMQLQLVVACAGFACQLRRLPHLPEPPLSRLVLPSCDQLAAGDAHSAATCATHTPSCQHAKPHQRRAPMQCQLAPSGDTGGEAEHSVRR